MRDLDWLINSIEYDHLEDDEDVQGTWSIARLDTPDDVIIVKYEPFNDSPYPSKVTKYRVTKIEEVEGDDAQEAYLKWLTY